ncbi:flavin-dependent dehydrogenase [Lutibacter sp. Hel_I_33_5]|uniref:NAD(P)/FAD-dependent oxidoreductase n=1 Tax=Lutibacter sp. Hel_I_33_5 TaxID=1566289 RepID=UPI0011A2BDC5|nr:NAD(P)/FAD-dependent oxidoreductase [Lutibacter sp. Hel_I_33_5]TVZ56809.1 flavin-dependent dehydrogenase [Lutibacter sp. Hel_I_33_5]
MIKKFDVIIVGGGPSGGQCARILSKKGHKVLLVEKHNSFEDNNFSSAGMTLAPLKEFDLPDTVVGSYWKGIDIQCSKKNYAWKSNKREGVVLDFGRLRQFLADEAVNNGAELLLGYKYYKKEYDGDAVIAHFQNSKTKEKISFKAKLLIDGTGPVRKVIYDDKNEEPELSIGTGIEYLIKVDDKTYNSCADKLVFFLGHKWAKNGYGWIFPMESNILKVGAGKIFVEDENQANISIKEDTLRVIEEFLELKEYELLDIHGGIIRYSPGINDTFYKNKVVAIGDAISAINPKGGEGIRYAMRSATVASKYIDTYLSEGKDEFDKYKKKWRSKHRISWRLSELSARKLYLKYSDSKIEERIGMYHSITNMQVLIDSLFEFKPGKIFHKIVLLYMMTAKLKLKKLFSKS